MLMLIILASVAWCALGFACSFISLRWFGVNKLDTVDVVFCIIGSVTGVGVLIIAAEVKLLDFMCRGKD